jgi:transcriptional regulator with GAF, ATPase, and Fis domain
MIDQANQTRQEDSRKRSRESLHLEVQTMRNWYLLASFTAISTIGLVIAVTPVIRQSIRAFWPWANTDVVLLTGFVGMVLILILHLTLQQVRVRKLRLDFRSMEERAHERDRQSSARLHALLNVTRMMGAVSEPAKLFDGIADICLEIFECQQASLMVLNPETQMLEMKAACGHRDPEKIRNVQQPVGKGIAGHVALTKEPLILGASSGQGSYRGFELQAKQLTAAMVAPIIVRDELVGVLNISSRKAGADYTEDDLQALKIFAESVGTCIRQSERSEWMRQTIERHQSQITFGH